MNIPAEILDELKCSSCEAYLSRGPVYLQHNGAAVCGRCYTPKHPATRNTQYEATAKLLKFPCKNRDLGCPVTVFYAKEAEVVTHEEGCEYRQYVCPVLGSARCDWLGPRAVMLTHCRDQHPDSILENPCNLIHDITRASLHNYIISAFQVLFLLHTKVCLATAKVFHAVRLLGSTDEATNYHFTLDIKRNDLLISRPGRVAPQGCLAIQEDSSLGMNTNSLLDVLGGFDGTTFTVTVKRRVSDAAHQLTRVMEKCTECKAVMTWFGYRDEKGWRCEHCAPTKRACEKRDQGCKHTDIPEKCTEHEYYFCQQRTSCYICGAALSQGSLSEHYSSVHQRITCTWRATRTVGRYCLVSSVAGTAVCWYLLNDLQFVLYVRVPVSSERLSEFRCEVRLADPTTGHVRTFTSDVLYNVWYDWRIVVKKEEFQSRNVVCDVSIDIIKI